MATINNLNPELTAGENSLMQASDEQLRAVVYDGAELPGVGGIGNVTQVAQGANQRGLLDSTESDVDLVIGVLVGVEAGLFVAEKAIDFVQEIRADEIEGFLEHLSAENLGKLAERGFNEIQNVVEDAGELIGRQFEGIGESLTGIGESIGLVDPKLTSGFGPTQIPTGFAGGSEGAAGLVSHPDAVIHTAEVDDPNIFDGIDKGQLAKIASVGLSVGAGFLLSTKEGQLAMASALQAIRIIQKIKQAKEIAEKALATLSRLA
jgi:hypothetical protein